MKAKINNQNWADFKRLIEICSAKREWLEEFVGNPQEFLQTRALLLQPETAREALGVSMLGEACPESNIYIQKYKEVVGRVYSLLEQRASVDKIADARFKVWYERQKNRNEFQSRVSRHMEGLIYVPAAFELAEGCSVGCDFCCLAAGPLKKVFSYNQESAELWRKILRITQNVLGGIAGLSSCYYATEPMDTPGYEKFLLDYHDIFHAFPQTTTAAAHRNIERTKALMEMLKEELPNAVLRFSVTSLEQLERIHREFTSRELQYVELLMNNHESLMGYTRAGRSVELSGHISGKNFTESASSACTSGFVVNMARKTVTLTTPHRPDDRHPLGMRIYECRNFQDEKDYQKILEEMIEKWMPLEFPEDRELYPSGYITFERLGTYIKVKGDGISRTVTMDDREYTAFRQVMQEGMSFQETSERNLLTEYERGRLREKMTIFYESGYLDENKI